MRQVGAVTLVAAPIYAVLFVWLGFSPKTTDVGYQPTQPIPFSHAVHAGELGMDCRYCHTTVERAAHAAIPPTQTCMTCHTMIKPESENLRLVWESYESGLPIEWVKIHDLPDYAYFNHAVHVNAGVSCVECHGRVDRMEVVWQHEELSMGWCLECHRNPEEYLRPREFVTVLDWQPEEGVSRMDLGRQLRQEYHLNPNAECSTCHR